MTPAGPELDEERSGTNKLPSAGGLGGEGGAAGEAGDDGVAVGLGAMTGLCTGGEGGGGVGAGRGRGDAGVGDRIGGATEGEDACAGGAVGIEISCDFTGVGVGESGVFPLSLESGIGVGTSNSGPFPEVGAGGGGAFPLFFGSGAFAELFVGCCEKYGGIASTDGAVLFVELAAAAGEGGGGTVPEPGNGGGICAREARDGLACESAGAFGGSMPPTGTIIGDVEEVMDGCFFTSGEDGSEGDTMLVPLGDVAGAGLCFLSFEPLENSPHWLAPPTGCKVGLGSTRRGRESLTVEGSFFAPLGVGTSFLVIDVAFFPKDVFSLFSFVSAVGIEFPSLPFCFGLSNERESRRGGSPLALPRGAAG